MNLSIYWQLQDIISPALRNIMAVSQRTEAILARANAGLQRGFANTNTEVSALQNNLQGLNNQNVNIGTDAGGVANLSRNLSGIPASLQRVVAESNRVRSILGDTGFGRGVNMAARDLGNLRVNVDAIRGRNITVGVNAAPIVQANRQLAVMPSMYIRIRESVGRFTAGVNSSFANFQNRMQGSAMSVNTLREKIESLRSYRNNLVIGVDTHEIDRANRELTTLEGRLARAEGQHNNRATGGGGILAGLGLGGLGVAGGILATVATAQSAMNKGMDMQVVEQQFKHFVGNQKVAENLMIQLRAYSDKYAMYSRKEVLESATMISETFGSSEVMKITNMVGALAKGNHANFQGITVRLQQIKGTGYLQGEELMELMNRGVFGLQQQIAKNKNVSLAQFNKLKEARQVSYSDVEKALLQMTSAGGKYAGVLDEVMGTTKGKWDSIKALVDNKLTDLGKGMSGGMYGLMDGFYRFLKESKPIEDAFMKLVGAFNPLWRAIKTLATDFGLIPATGDGVTQSIAMIEKVVSLLAMGVSIAATGIEWFVNLLHAIPFGTTIAGAYGIFKVMQAMDVMSKVNNVVGWFMKIVKIPFADIMAGINGLKSVWMALNTSFLFTPIGAIIVGILALVAALIYAWQNSETFRAVVIQTWEGIKAVWAGLVDVFMNLWANAVIAFDAIKAVVVQHFNYVHGKVMGFWNAITGFFAGIWTYVSELSGKISNVISAAFGRAMTAIRPYVQWIFDAFDWLGEKVGKVWDWIAEKIEKVLGGVKKAAKFAFDVTPVGMYFNTVDWMSQKFAKGFQQGGQVAYEAEQKRKAGEKANKGKPKSGIFDSLIPESIKGGFGGGAANGADGSGKAGGITDTVEGTRSKVVNITFKSMIENSNIFVDKQGDGLDIESKILDALNRVLSSGEKLAYE